MRRVFGLVAVGILLFGGLIALQSAWAGAVADTGATNSSNETVAVTDGALVTLNNSNVVDYQYDRESEVAVRQNGTTWIAAGNWSWIRANGTLRWADPTGLNTSENASVTYGWRESTDLHELGKQVSLLPLQLGEIVLVALAAAAVLGTFIRVGRALP